MSANDHQVGGDHYRRKGVIQHWDLAVMHQWDPFQYQITKYVMRWKDKHQSRDEKLKDLKKAAHFLEKYIEEYESYLLPENVCGAQERPRDVGYDPTQDTQNQLKPFKEYEKNAVEYCNDAHYLCEGGWGDGTLLFTCQYCRCKFKGFSLLDVHEQHDAECKKGRYHEMGRINPCVGQTAQSSANIGGSVLPSVLEERRRGLGSLSGTGNASCQANSRPVDKPGTGFIR